MIDGPKLTVTREGLQRMLEECAAEQRATAERWNRERTGTVDDQTERAPLLPNHMCDNEAERHDWRAGVLDLLREPSETGEIYRLAESRPCFVPEIIQITTNRPERPV